MHQSPGKANGFIGALHPRLFKLIAGPRCSPLFWTTLWKCGPFKRASTWHLKNKSPISRLLFMLLFICMLWLIVVHFCTLCHWPLFFFNDWSVPPLTSYSWMFSYVRLMIIMHAQDWAQMEVPIFHISIETSFHSYFKVVFLDSWAFSALHIFGTSMRQVILCTVLRAGYILKLV